MVVAHEVGPVDINIRDFVTSRPDCREISISRAHSTRGRTFAFWAYSVLPWPMALVGGFARAFSLAPLASSVLGRLGPYRAVL